MTCCFIRHVAYRTKRHRNDVLEDVAKLGRPIGRLLSDSYFFYETSYFDILQPYGAC